MNERADRLAGLGAQITAHFRAGRPLRLYGSGRLTGTLRFYPAQDIGLYSSEYLHFPRIQR